MLTYQEANRRVAAKYGAKVQAPASTVMVDEPELSYADKVINWIEAEFYVPETGLPLVLYPYQKAVMREALRTDENGLLVYDLVLWGDIKKSLKSIIGGGRCLYTATHMKWGSIKIIANDLDQAQSRLYEYIKRAILLNPRLSNIAKINKNTITFDNYSIIKAIPVDPKGEAGGSDDLIEFTELHAADSPKAMEMWAEMTISPMKHGKSQRWIDTYAGWSGKSPILEPMYKNLVKEENRIDVGIPGLPVYAIGRQLCLWNDTPRLPWQTPEYYAGESRTLPENQFNRIHRNMWGSAKSTFVHRAWWDRCKRDSIAALDKYREIVIALDAAVSSDCFGMVVVSRSGDNIIQRYARKWTPPHNGVIMYSNPDNKLDREYPEGELRWWIANYNVIVVGYDPHQLHHFCTQLEAENVAWFFSFQQGEPRLKADKRFHDIIRDGQYIHDGNPDMTEHVLNADAQTENERLRIVKRSDELKIDLCVCGSMASDLAYEHLPG